MDATISKVAHGVKVSLDRGEMSVASLLGTKQKESGYAFAEIELR
jgi:hypothetical protein